MRRFLMVAFALSVVACGSNSPTGPTRATDQNAPTSAAPTLDLDLDAMADDAPDTSAFSLALARLGDLGQASNASNAGDSSSLSEHADWFLDILRAPKTGQVFKVNRVGMLPKPPPQFRFRVQAPVNIPESVILVYFLTAGSRECGFATTRSPFPLTANAPRTIDIPNDYILVGPEACFLPGQNCTRTQCKFPLTTTKMRILFGNTAQGVAQGTESYKYKWVTTTPTNPNPNPTPPPNNPPPAGPSCNGAPVPSNCTVGNGPPPPTARCNDGQWTCSQTSSGTCSGHGGIDCRVCPGPLC